MFPITLQLPSCTVQLGPMGPSTRLKSSSTYSVDMVPYGLSMAIPDDTPVNGDTDGLNSGNCVESGDPVEGGMRRVSSTSPGAWLCAWITSKGASKSSLALSWSSRLPSAPRGGSLPSALATWTFAPPLRVIITRARSARMDTVFSLFIKTSCLLPALN